MLVSPRKPASCFLCRRRISHASGASFVAATFTQDPKPRLFHLRCFVAFTTGTLHNGDIWAYCIVRSATNTESQSLMRVWGWLCVGGGVVLIVTAFLTTAHAPKVNPWPILAIGFCLTAVGTELRSAELTSRDRPLTGAQSLGRPPSKWAAISQRPD